MGGLAGMPAAGRQGPDARRHRHLDQLCRASGAGGAAHRAASPMWSGASGSSPGRIAASARPPATARSIRRSHSSSSARWSRARARASTSVALIGAHADQRPQACGWRCRAPSTSERELGPGDIGMDLVAGARGAEAAIRSGDDALAPDHFGEAHDALRHQLGMLDQMDAMRHDAGDQDLAVGQLRPPAIPAIRARGADLRPRSE